MKYRIKQGTNSLDGLPIFRIYRFEGETEMYLAAAATMDKAHEMLQRMMNPIPEVTVAEFDA
jgi:hypothetical protein